MLLIIKFIYIIINLFRFEDRLKYSLKVNGIFYCIMGIIGFGFVTIIMYIGLEGEYGLINFFKSLANCWGIFLIMILLGNYPKKIQITIILFIYINKSNSLN